MSVVNKMLQDLESRQQEPAGAGANYQPPAKSSILPWVLSVVLLVACSVFAYQLLMQTNQPPAQHAELVSPAVTVSNEAVGPTQNSSMTHDTDEVQSNNIVAAESVASAATAKPVEDITAKTESNLPSDPQMETTPPEEPASDSIDHTEPPMVQTSVSEQQVARQPVKPVFEMTSNADKTPARSLKQLAQDALQAGDSLEAARYLNQLVSLEPTNLPARKKLAALLFAQNQNRSAETLLLEGLQVHPGSAELRLMLARLYAQNGHSEKAHDLLQTFSVSALLEPEYLAFRASLADQLSRFQFAKSDYSALSRAFPDNSKWWLGLAVSQERLGENQGALLAYQKANSLNQLSTEVSSFVQQRLQFLEDAR